ncbi:Tyrosine-protein kinase etk [Posidoniimonas corsicana]|uniref:Tyrosine-protein kinase etk n=1 Tax=Posidoniimonas corsicana TaxID=1938618 RepID=A0A5C5V6Q5_9BACT|nr:polysaccharide biosynthesis tyrosine autokinase [Posidoniimonas corsicana]TWT33790.1 Tyrosine-protein kinase etk [Posidoniimonas corsicana]
MSKHEHPTEPNFMLQRVDQSGSPQPIATQSNSRHWSAPQNAPQQFTPKFLVWVFLRHWKLVVPSGLVLAAAAVSALLWTYQPDYLATGLVRIEDTQPYIAFEKASVGSANSAFVRTQIELMRSPLVIREVLSEASVGKAEHLVAKPDKLKHIKENLSIRQIGGSELYDVSYTSPSAQESQDIVAAVIKKYFVLQSDEQYKQVQRVVDLLEKERVRRKLEVDRLQQYVVELSKEVTGKDPFGHNTLMDVDKAISPLASLHSQLTDVEVRIEILHAEIQSLEESEVTIAPHADRAGAIDLEVNMAPEVVQRERALTGIADQMRHYQRVSKRYEQNANYKALAEQYQRFKDELAGYKANLRRKLLLSTRSERPFGGSTVVDEKRKELAALQIQQRSLKTRFQAELKSVQDSGGKGAELEFAKAELAREEKVFEMIAARKLALQTETNAPARVRVMGPIVASPTPVESAPWKKIFLACGVGMLAPFGLVLLREVTLRRVADAEQLYEDTRLRVLGEISVFPSRRVAANPRRLPRRIQKEMYSFAESIDSLRMSLTFCAPSERNRVIALTSAVSGEGKTSVSVALAMSFANATGAKTLLVDGDMRDPSINDLVDAEPGPGLYEVLSSRCSISDAIRPAKGTDNLYVLRAGDCDDSPHRVAQPARIAALVSRLRNEFSTVVIDTPPVLGASEALSFCRSADMTAMCTLRGKSRGRQIRLALDQLESAGASVSGSILSGVPSYSYSYAYGYGFRNPTEHSGGIEVSR